MPRLCLILLFAWFGLSTRAAEFEFQHHFINRTLPVTEKSVGDYGLTALIDIDKDGDLDFVAGGRPVQPSQLYWFEYREPGEWIQHVVGTNYLSDVGLAALDIDHDGWVDFVCSGVWYRNTGKPRTEPFERFVFQVGDVDGDGDVDIVSKAWGPRPWNGNSGRMHVDYLENLFIGQPGKSQNQQ